MLNRNSFSFAFLLNLLCPGLGHAFWREYAFGSFVFLVMVLSALLGVVAVIFTVSIWVRIGMYILPLLFYGFTFVDLRRVTKARTAPGRTIAPTAAFLVASIGWQLLSPLAPVNFGLNNFPSVFRQPDNSLSPTFHQGDILAANSLAYKASFAFVSHPQFFALPELGDLVQYEDSAGARPVGIVGGLPGDQIEVDDGKLYIGPTWYELAEFMGFRVGGTVELTAVEPGSILILKVRLGEVTGVEQVPLGNIIGKVHRIF
jgi:signal peptidase I